MRPSYAGFVALAALLGCRAREERQGAPVASAAPPVSAPVPPVAHEGVAPSPGAATTPAPSGEPYEQALAYEAGGQLWLARLVLEKPALGEGAAPRDTELLARLCAAQGDAECVTKCGARLGRKLAFDAGAPRAASLPSARPAENDDASRAQRALLKGDAEGARRLLQPKLVAKTISEPELVVLRAACERQRDTMCVLACDGAKKR